MRTSLDCRRLNSRAYAVLAVGSVLAGCSVLAGVALCSISAICAARRLARVFAVDEPVAVLPNLRGCSFSAVLAIKYIEGVLAICVRDSHTRTTRNRVGLDGWAYAILSVSTRGTVFTVLARLAVSALFTRLTINAIVDSERMVAVLVGDGHGMRAVAIGHLHGRGEAVGTISAGVALIAGGTVSAGLTSRRLARVLSVDEPVAVVSNLRGRSLSAIKTVHYVKRVLTSAVGDGDASTSINLRSGNSRAYAVLSCDTRFAIGSGVSVRALQRFGCVLGTVAHVKRDGRVLVHIDRNNTRADLLQSVKQLLHVVITRLRCIT